MPCQSYTYFISGETLKTLVLEQVNLYQLAQYSISGSHISQSHVSLSYAQPKSCDEFKWICTVCSSLIICEIQQPKLTKSIKKESDRTIS